MKLKKILIMTVMMIACLFCFTAVSNAAVSKGTKVGASTNVGSECTVVHYLGSAKSSNLIDIGSIVIPYNQFKVFKALKSFEKNGKKYALTCNKILVDNEEISDLDSCTVQSGIKNVIFIYDEVTSLDELYKITVNKHYFYDPGIVAFKTKEQVEVKKGDELSFDMSLNKYTNGEANAYDYNFVLAYLAQDEGKGITLNPDYYKKGDKFVYIIEDKSDIVVRYVVDPNEYKEINVTCKVIYIDGEGKVVATGNKKITQGKDLPFTFSITTEYNEEKYEVDIVQINNKTNSSIAKQIKEKNKFTEKFDEDTSIDVYLKAVKIAEIKDDKKVEEKTDDEKKVEDKKIENEKKLEEEKKIEEEKKLEEKIEEEKKAEELTGAAAITSGFIDVDDNAWYASSVKEVTEKGLMKGISDNQFAPGEKVTRSMFVTILHRMEKEPVATNKATHEDIVSGSFYEKATDWAIEKGIVTGYSDKVFAPNDFITREQIITILYRYAKLKKVDVSVGENTNILSYEDAFDIGEYAIPAMQWACGAGVISGKDGIYLDPKGFTTRAEAAKMIVKMLGLIK